MHDAKGDARCKSYNQGCREEMNDRSYMRLPIIRCHHDAAVNATVVTRELCTLVTHVTSKILAIYDRWVTAALDVNKKYRLDVATRWCCRVGKTNNASDLIC